MIQNALSKPIACSPAKFGPSQLNLGPSVFSLLLFFSGFSFLLGPFLKGPRQRKIYQPLPTQNSDVSSMDLIRRLPQTTLRCAGHFRPKIGYISTMCPVSSGLQISSKNRLMTPLTTRRISNVPWKSLWSAARNDQRCTLTGGRTPARNDHQTH